MMNSHDSQEFDHTLSHMRTVEWALQHGRGRAGLTDSNGPKMKPLIFDKLKKYIGKD